MLTEPWVLSASVAVVTVNVSFVSGSVSLPNTLMPFKAVLKGVLAISVLAVGASLLPLIVMVTLVGVPSNDSTVIVSVSVSPTPKACTAGWELLTV